MSEFQYQSSTKWWCHQWLGLNLLKLRSFLGIIPKVFPTKFHQIWIAKSKVIHVQIPVPKWEKTRKRENIFWVKKRGNKGITNRGKRDYKQRQLQGFQIGTGIQIGENRFQIGARGISNRDRDCKSGQGLQTGAEKIFPNPRYRSLFYMKQ